MLTTRASLGVGLCMLIAMPLASTAGAQPAQPANAAATTEPATKLLKPEELEQLLAPIALYPDTLLTQLLMASTYPLDIVEAERWQKQNKDLKDKALTEALEKQSWDPSVKSLIQFPDILSMMSQKLNLTVKLGD